MTTYRRDGHEYIDLGVIDASGRMGALQVTREYDVLYDRTERRWLIDVIDSSGWRTLDDDEAIEVAERLGLNKMVS